MVELKALLVIPYVFVINLILSGYFGTKKLDKKYIMVNSLVALLLGISFFLDRSLSMVKMLMILLYLAIACYYYSEGNVVKTFMSILGLFIAMNVGELIMASIITGFMKIPLHTIVEDPVLYLSGSLLSLMMTLAVAKLARGKKFFEEIVIGFDERQQRSIVLFVFMTLVVVFGNLFILATLLEVHTSGALLFLVVVLMVYTVFTVVFIRVNRNLSMKSEENDQLRFYINIIEDLVEASSAFRHDYNNIMTTLGGYIETNDFTALKKYYSSILAVSSKAIDKNYYQLKNIVDPGIKGLLTTKVNSIDSKGYKLEFEAGENIVINMDVLDFSRIIGILVDNAIEGAGETTEQSIKLGFIQEGEGLSIIVANTVTGQPNLNEIYKKGVSSKGKGRGTGLWNVREILDQKYDDVVLNTNVIEGYFVQEMIIYN